VQCKKGLSSKQAANFANRRLNLNSNNVDDAFIFLVTKFQLSTTEHNKKWEDGGLHKQ